jgi:uncharacterized protein YndB with AHSA1/START domain
MKIFLLLVLTLIALVGLILLIGASLPREHRVSRELLLRWSPAEVYAVLRDFANMPSWRTNVTRVDILEPVDRRLRFREHSKEGAVTYELLEDIPTEKMVTQIVDRDLGYSGSWTYELVPEMDGTLLRITENGDVSNVFFRFMSRFVFGQTKTIETYLADLSAKLK